MSCKRLGLRRRARLAWLCAAVFSALASSLAAAEDCLQKTEVFHVDEGMVRTVMRYNGTTLLETIQHEGLFQLDRLDRGVRTKYEPQTDLKRLFPLKPGRTAKAEFKTESNGRGGTLSVELAIKAMDVLWIGPCKYTVLKIDRTEAYNGGPPRFVDTDYYSPELRLILGKGWPDRDGTHTEKYDRIYSLRAGQAD
jgi:hypothetical protein